MLEDIKAAQEAEANAAFVAKQEAQIAQLKQLNNAVSPVVRTGGGNGGPKGDNSFGGSGNGFGASSKSGSTKSGQTDYGFF